VLAVVMLMFLRTRSDRRFWNADIRPVATLELRTLGLVAVRSEMKMYAPWARWPDLGCVM